MTNTKDKFICSHCVDDHFLNTWINKEGENHICNYCGSESNCVKIEVLCSWVDDVYRRNFQPGEHYPSFADGSDKVDWVVGGASPEEIIGDLLCCEENVVNDVLEFLSDSEAYDVNKDAAIPYYETTFGYEETPVHDFEHSQLWDDFCEHVKHRSRFFSTPALDLLNKLFTGISDLQFSNGNAPIRTVDINSDDKFIYRARTARSDYERVKFSLYPDKELGAPPENNAVAGRMNPAGISVFYGALDRKTCLSELRLPVGDVAISGKFEIIKPLVLMDLSSFNGLYEVLSLFDPDFETKSSQLNFLRRFEKEVSKPILPGDEVLEYIPTQALVEYLANYHAPKIDGLLYSSTQTNGSGKNVVIFNHAADIAHVKEDFIEDNKRFEVIWSDDDLSYSIYETSDENRGIQIDNIYPTKDEKEASLKLIEDNLEVHLIKGIEHSYDSDTVRISYKEDLEKVEF